MTSSTPTPVALAARTVVLDLEGTTSAAGFILGDLYDYARPRLLPWLQEHADDEEVADARAQAITDAELPPDASDEDIVAALLAWMDSDVKATPLKTLQGQIWAEGFERHEITSQFFDDVIPKLHAWHASGVRLAVFSSGSVTSQRPWFKYSPEGDLSGLITDYFDTVKAGPKKAAESYRTIARALGDEPGQLVFFSDHPEEIAAASHAGWQVLAFSREGEPWFGADFGDAPVVGSFADVEVSRL
ncbi:acireductone synthase [Saxibacter everestensis]|uniref:Enolase-phosphatase E1 n=1 Tax=Saxibacter everestensis TaxID=2909229 RepID=A0ABY8QSC4_9MICO|nr:acireductone synthase [Brevibacteriaceae bacterium ZFBP1038]